MDKKNVSDLSGKISDNVKFQDEIRGPDLEQDLSIEMLLRSYRTTGIQASNLYKGIVEIKKMVKSDAKIYLGTTSNIISSGLREVIRYMAKYHLFHVYVCTGGGIEEDIIKCLKPTYLGEFSLDGKVLRENGWNRIGNMVINNDNYNIFEKWMNSFLDLLISGKSEASPRDSPYTPENPLIITPSKFIWMLGKHIDNDSSVLYWCYRNKIPVYSPAITDGSIGDMITFYRHREFIKIDIVEDIHKINMESMHGKENGAIIVGSGLIKHHIFNANLFNNGLDYCVLLNTAIEYDGSDSGASLSESYSWGKVKPEKTCVKIYGEASIILPLLIYGSYRTNIEIE